ncbi:phage holin family protein [Miniimonas arenae]|uniref:phage holin family protein n=1 Tax=Miniimonas arenae TaxID=676201 RepID=UPI0028A99760|nr:phage holin family protein [Miniimonas arenae]
MIRFLLNFAINLVLAALGLLLADALFDDVTVHASGFVVAVLIVAVAQAVLAPFVFNMARKYASAVLGGVGLISTLLALWIASLFDGGLEITGAAGWAGATLVVWLTLALGGWLLGWLILTRWWDRKREAKRIRAATR